MGAGGDVPGDGDELAGDGEIDGVVDAGEGDGLDGDGVPGCEELPAGAGRCAW